MKGCLTVLAVLLFIGLLIKFPAFFLGAAIAIWGFALIKKQKEAGLKTKTAPAIIIIGVVVALTGCVGSFDDESAEKSGTPQVEKKSLKETAPDPVTSEKPTEETKPESDKKVPVAGGSATEKKPAATSKPGPVKKTDTAGTTNQIPVTLLKTVDGDTIKVRYNGEEINIRYLLIDTPETNHPRLGKQPFGEEAKERNRQLVNSGKLTIEFDIGERYDKYDRLLAYVYVDGKSVQKTLLAEGLARVAYVYPPNTRYLTPFEEAQAAAKKKGLGIWSVENYATDSGFNSDAVATNKPSNTQTKKPAAPSTTTSKPAATPSTGSTGGSEWFQNCTELRKKYSAGVPQGHPAYQAKMDRDKDGFACER
ncbi:thermonuclease family protein [Sporosarcina cyprini]|uniref:thermonuclease family protein n=1 Tax=Sporosarcina cyprini TaxID=2910523 RepID=UPI001EDD765C|nr:thermonuclease family protein [Sporosarcina cyprini]MCG3089612.1 thermonuclease family protein [Sporosarcina cyprini]